MINQPLTIVVNETPYTFQLQSRNGLSSTWVYQDNSNVLKLTLRIAHNRVKASGVKASLREAVAHRCSISLIREEYDATLGITQMSTHSSTFVQPEVSAVLTRADKDLDQAILSEFTATEDVVDRLMRYES